MVNCRKLNVQTDNSPTRATDIASAAPDCACEKQLMSKFSPGMVRGTETLARFLFNKSDGSDFHISKNGKPKPSAYAHAFTKGCSVQREDKASDGELAYFLQKKYLPANAQHVWRGLVQAGCQQLKDLKLTGDNHQLFCVYDTGEADNPAHAEICVSRKLADDGEMPEARSLIRGAFGESITTPEAYRSGRIKYAVENTDAIAPVAAKQNIMTIFASFIVGLWRKYTQEMPGH